MSNSLQTCKICGDQISSHRTNFCYECALEYSKPKNHRLREAGKEHLCSYHGKATNTSDEKLSEA